MHLKDIYDIFESLVNVKKCSNDSRNEWGCERGDESMATMRMLTEFISYPDRFFKLLEFTQFFYKVSFADVNFKFSFFNRQKVLYNFHQQTCIFFVSLPVFKCNVNIRSNVQHEIVMKLCVPISMQKYSISISQLSTGLIMLLFANVLMMDIFMFLSPPSCEHKNIYFSNTF